MPLVWEFTPVLRSNVLKRLDSHLFDFRQQPGFRATFEVILSNPALHYEQMVGQLESIHLSQSLNAQIAFNTARQFIDCIQIILAEDQLNTTPLFAEKVKDYSGLTALLKMQPYIDVFSLNHDVNFEEICKFHGLPYRDGFFDNGAHHYGHITQFKTLTKSQIDSGKLNFFGSEDEGINLIKLHGSLDTFAVEDKNLYLKVSPREDVQLGAHVTEILRVESHSNEVCAKLKSRGVGELFVMDSNGELQFFRRSLLSGAQKFKDRLEQIAPMAFFLEFQRRLELATQIDVIGYGFGDSHINEVLANRFADRNVSMNIYDPNRDSVPSELSSWSDRITLFPIGLTGYCDKLSRPLDSLLLGGRREFLQLAREHLRQKRSAL